MDRGASPVRGMPGGYLAAGARGGWGGTMSEREFSPRALLAALGRPPAAARYWVAYSGGLDSTVLLHALAEVRGALPGDLRAVHVDHGLHPEAGRWAGHCREVCARLDLACEVLSVSAVGQRGESPEAAARQARYRVLGQLLGPGEAVLTAHHRDDQAETVLLRLLRGAGARGLAAMAEHRPLGLGWLGRPLLPWPRSALRAWAVSRRLGWVEDPSNRETRLDRNFLRLEVLPLLERRWPACSRTLARAAAHQAEAQGLLEDLARAELEACRGEAEGTLSVRALLALPPARRRLVLCAWLGARGLPAPPGERIERVAHEVLEARADGRPYVTWPGGEVRRYRDALVAGAPRGVTAADASWPWRPPAPLQLPWGVLKAEPAVSVGLSARALEGRDLTVRVRRGGERCRVAGRGGGRHAVKKLLQEAGVPPWDRERLPFVYAGEDLAAVADLWVCEPFACPPGESGWRVVWTPSGPIL